MSELFLWKEQCIHWCSSQNINDENLISSMKEDFSTAKEWEENKDRITDIMVQSLPEEDVLLWQACKKFQGSHNQGKKEKEMMKQKKNIQNKVYKWVEKLKRKMDYEEDEESLLDENIATITKKQRRDFLNKCNKLTAKYFDEIMEAGVSTKQLVIKSPFEPGDDVVYTTPFSISHDIEHPPNTSFTAFKWWLLWMNSPASITEEELPGEAGC